MAPRVMAQGKGSVTPPYRGKGRASGVSENRPCLGHSPLSPTGGEGQGEGAASDHPPLDGIAGTR
jgi:hypothetical protein